MTAAARNRLIGAVHAAKTAAGLDDDTYRDTLERIAGKRSAKDCTDVQLRAFLDHVNASTGAPRHTRRRADGPQVGKLTALWWSLYHLDVIDNPSDAALAAFILRMTGVAALQWADAAQLATVIDGLKAMAARDGGVDWSPIKPGQPRDPRLAVATAQWKRLQERGAELPALTLHAFAVSLFHRPLAALLPTDWTKLHKELGTRLRAARPEVAS